jgi:hypothetical protein
VFLSIQWLTWLRSLSASDFGVKSSTKVGGQNMEDREGLNSIVLIYIGGHNGLLRFGANLDRSFQSARFTKFSY